MRILCVVTGNYGTRIVSHLCRTAPADWQVLFWEGPRHLPSVVDDPERFLPTSLPQADLLLSLAEHAGLSDLVADLAEQCEAQAVIAPIDRWSWLPPGLSKQLARRLQNRGMGCAFPSPFCSLHPSHQGHPLINAFADRFGSPELRCTVADGHITAWEIQREAPCGNTRFVADKLVGAAAERAEEMAGLLHHYYPCLAAMDQVGAHSHTLLHQAAKIACSAVARALSASQSVHLIQPSNSKLHGEEKEYGSARISGIMER